MVARGTLEMWLCCCMLLLLTLTQQTNALIMVQTGGGTFPAQVYQAWQYGYTYVDPTVLFSYAAVGSGAGVTGLNSGLYSMGASDSASLVASVTPFGDGQLIPLLAGSIVPAYNLNLGGTLVLDGETLVQIFLGNINNWDHPAIQALNPSLTMPNLTITLIVRSDSSGSTSIFTSALASFSSAWPSTAVGTLPIWNATVVKHYENAGVAIAVRENIGAIGYCGISYASQYGVAFANLINQAQVVVTANVSSVIAAIQGATFDQNFSAVVVNSPHPAAWPITGFTYLVLKRTSLTDCTVALYLVQFLRWVSIDANALAVANQYGFVSITSEFNSTVSSKVWAALGEVQCDGVHIAFQLQPYQKTYYTLAAIISFVLFAVFLSLLWYRRQAYLRSHNWAMQLISLFGCALLMCSIYAWEGSYTTASCHVQIWFTAVGSTLFFARIWAKSVRPWQYFPGYSVTTPVTDMLIFKWLLGLLAIDVIVCIVWSSTGDLQMVALTTCSTNGFWGFFGFFLGYKYFLVITALVYALNTPPSLSYFGETLYMVLASSTIIVLTALFLPVILLIQQVPNGIIRQLFSPSVLIMNIVVVVVTILSLHKIILRYRIEKARNALNSKERSSSLSNVLSSTEDHEPSETPPEKDTELTIPSPSTPDLPFGATKSDLGMFSAPFKTSSGEFTFVTPTDSAVIDMKTPSSVSPKPTDQSRKKQRNSLEKLLHDPSARLYLRHVFASLRCNEVLEFWLAVKEYQTLTKPTARFDFATTMFTLYIRSNAEEQINLTESIRNGISKKMQAAQSVIVTEEGKTVAPMLPNDLFEEASHQAFEMMWGVFIEHLSKHS